MKQTRLRCTLSHELWILPLHALVSDRADYWLSYTRDATFLELIGLMYIL